MIFGTCGHEIDDEWFDSNNDVVAIKDLTRDGKPCISFVCLCRDCHKEYKQNGLILTEDQIEKYFFKQRRKIN